MIQDREFRHSWSKIAADPRWQISKQLIQDGGFQKRLYKMGGHQNSWSNMANSKPRRQISEQLIQDGGHQNSWSKRLISKEWTKMDSKIADPRWQISKQLIQDDGFQSRWYKMADIRTAYPRFLKRWSKMADFIGVDPSRRISEQLTQDGGFQNSWYKMADIRTAYPRFLKRWSKIADFIRVDPSRRISEQLKPRRRISEQLIQNGGWVDPRWRIPEQLTQDSWYKMADSKTADLPEQKSEGQAEQWRPAKEGFSAFSSSYPKQREFQYFK